MHITLIAALARGRAIGYKNGLLYHLPADLRRFKALTTGHTVVMGRRTFESLPKGALPNRRNIVLSRQVGASFPGAETFATLRDALASCRQGEQVFVIGGASVYKEALPLADRLCLTRIAARPPRADVYFPRFNSRHWRVALREKHTPDAKNRKRYQFVDYVRRR